MNVNGEIEQNFPGFRDSLLQNEWNTLEESLGLGKSVKGKIVSIFPFGYPINIGETFPAIMLATKIAPDSASMFVGKEISQVCLSEKRYPVIYIVFDRNKREIGITQQGRENWMEGTW